VNEVLACTVTQGCSKLSSLSVPLDYTCARVHLPFVSQSNIPPDHRSETPAMSDVRAHQAGKERRVTSKERDEVRLRQDIGHTVLVIKHCHPEFKLDRALR
jgi:hypothetical protein